MKTESGLAELYQGAQYPLVGHGPRNVKVLLDAFAAEDGSQGSDIYGKGELIDSFQEQMAELLGKEAAVFFPSGTMAQQIALRIWCDRRGIKKVAYHPLSHLEIHEEKGLQELHGIQSILLGERDRLITLEDIQAIGEDIGCLLLELPQREIGGQLPAYEELEAISAWCRSKGIPLHLDGARLFEIVPYYDRSEAEICSLFDSVYVSFYKGIGGIAGAILAGDSQLTEQSKVWKRRHGGDLISLYPYILSSAHYMEQRHSRMEQYYEEASELSAKFNHCPGMATVPAVPVSNMFHLHIELPRQEAESILAELCRETGVGILPALREVTATSCYGEISIGDRYGSIPKVLLDDVFQRLERMMSIGIA